MTGAIMRWQCCHMAATSQGHILMVRVIAASEPTRLGYVLQLHPGTSSRTFLSVSLLPSWKIGTRRVQGKDIREEHCV